ncbi:MAG: phospholipase D-like domain-containing protein [Nannocystales bacterium]
MTQDKFSLRTVTPEVLEAAWQLFTALPARARVTEAHVVDEQLRVALVDFLGQPAWILAGMLEAVLSERGRIETTQPPAGVAPRPVFRLERRYGNNTPELVWSGPTGGRSGARATRHVIEELFRAAKTSVFIAGYSFYRAAELFEPLRERVNRQPENGAPALKIRIVIDCSGVKDPSMSTDEIVQKSIAEFVRSCPQVRELGARVQYYVPSASRTDKGRALCSMHAKCIVVDDESVLVGSANFSNRGRDDRNLEVGALIRDANFASVLLAAWRDVSKDLVDVSLPPKSSGSLPG